MHGRAFKARVAVFSRVSAKPRNRFTSFQSMRCVYTYTHASEERRRENTGYPTCTGQRVVVIHSSRSNGQSLMAIARRHGILSDDAHLAPRKLFSIINRARKKKKRRESRRTIVNQLTTSCNRTRFFFFFFFLSLSVVRFICS